MSQFSNILEFVYVLRQVVGVSLQDGCGSDQEKVNGGDECGSEQKKVDGGGECGSEQEKVDGGGECGLEQERVDEGDECWLEQERVDAGGLSCMGSIQGGRCTSPNIEAPEEFEFASPQCSLVSEGVDCLKAVGEELSQLNVPYSVTNPLSLDDQSCVSQVSGELGLETIVSTGGAHSHYVACVGCLFECGGGIDEDCNVGPRQVHMSEKLNRLTEEELNYDNGEEVNEDDDDEDDEESETEFWFERSVNEKDEERFTLKIDESAQNCSGVKENVFSPANGNDSEQNMLKADELAQNHSQSEENVITLFIEKIENHKELEKNEQFTLQADVLPQNPRESEKIVISPCSGSIEEPRGNIEEPRGNIEEPRDSDQDLRIICGSFEPLCRMQPENDGIGLLKSEPGNCSEDPEKSVAVGYYLGKEGSVAVQDVRNQSDHSHDHGPQSCTCFVGKQNCSFCNLMQNPLKERHISAASFGSRPLVHFDVDVEKGSIDRCGQEDMYSIPMKIAASAVASTAGQGKGLLAEPVSGAVSSPGEVKGLLAEPISGAVSSPDDAKGLLTEPVSVFGLKDLMVEDVNCMSSDMTSANRQVHVSSTRREIGLERDHRSDQIDQIHGDDFIAKDHRREQIPESDFSSKEVGIEPWSEQGTGSIEAHNLEEERSHTCHHQDLQNEGELYSEIDLDIESFTFPLGCMNSDLNLSEFGLTPDQVDIGPGNVLVTDQASCQGDGSDDLVCPQRKTYRVFHDKSLKCTGFVNPAFFSDDIPEESAGEESINRRFFGACDAETGVCLNSCLPPVTVEECISDNEISDEDSFECVVGGNFYEEVSHVTGVDAVKMSEKDAFGDEMIDRWNGKESSFFGRMSCGVADKSVADDASHFRGAYAGIPGDVAEDVNHSPRVVRRSTVYLNHVINDLDKSAEDSSCCNGISADSLDDGEAENETTMWKSTVDSSQFGMPTVDSTSSVDTVVNAKAGRAREDDDNDKSQTETQPVNADVRNNILRSPLPFIETFQQEVRQIYLKRVNALPGLISSSLAEGNNSICDSGTEKRAGLDNSCLVTETYVDNTEVDSNSVVRSEKKDPSILSQDTIMGHVSYPCLPDTVLPNDVSGKHSPAYGSRMSTNGSSGEKAATSAVVWIYGSEYFVYSDGIYTRNTEYAVDESKVEDLSLDQSLTMLSEGEKDTEIDADEVTQVNAGLPVKTPEMAASGKYGDVGIGAGSTLMDSLEAEAEVNIEVAQHEVGTIENRYSADKIRESLPRKLKKCVGLAAHDLEVTPGATVPGFSNRIPPLGDDSSVCPVLHSVKTRERDASERALTNLKTEALVEPVEHNNDQENRDSPAVAVPDFSSSTPSDMKLPTRLPGSVARNVSLRLEPGHVWSMGAQPADLNITSTVVVDDESETLVCSNSFCSDGAQAIVTSTVNLLVPSLEIDITIQKQNPGTVSGTLELGEVSCGSGRDRFSDRQSQRNQMITSISGRDARGEESSGQVTFGVVPQASYSDLLACALNFVDVLFWICLAVAIIIFDFRNWTT